MRYQVRKLSRTLWSGNKSSIRCNHQEPKKLRMHYLSFNLLCSGSSFTQWTRITNKTGLSLCCMNWPSHTMTGSSVKNSLKQTMKNMSSGCARMRPSNFWWMFSLIKSTKSSSFCTWFPPRLSPRQFLIRIPLKWSLIWFMLKGIKHQSKLHIWDA